MGTNAVGSLSINIYSAQDIEPGFSLAAESKQLIENAHELHFSKKRKEKKDKRCKSEKQGH